MSTPTDRELEEYEDGEEFCDRCGLPIDQCDGECEEEEDGA